MNITCDVIKDLLPLYYDNVCSISSKKIIEEHLQTCTDCKNELELMRISLSATNKDENIKSAFPIKNISKKYKRSMIKFALKGIALTVVSLLLLALILSVFIDVRLVF